MLSASGLARALGIGRSTLYEWRRNGQLPPARGRLGRRRAWRRSDVQRWIELGQPDLTRFSALNEAAEPRPASRSRSRGVKR